MRTLAFGLTMLFVLSFAVSAFAATPEEISGLYGGDFRVAVKDTALDLNPKTASDEASLHMIDLLYDSLGRLDPVTLQVKPWVAESWSVDQENQTVTVVLRTDVLWHDDTPVTATDVEYTFGTYYGGYDVSILSPTEVRFDFSGGGGGKFMTEGLQKPLVKSDDAAPTEGCGPFEFIGTTAESVTIGAYSEYFHGRPYLDTIEFKVYQDIDAAANALINGTVDFIGWTLAPTDTTDARYENKSIMTEAEVGKLAISYTYGLEYLFIGFNPIDELATPELRKALAMAINKELFLSLEPNTIIVHSPMSSQNEPWYNRSIVKYNAGSFLNPAGETDTNYVPSLLELERLNYSDRDGDGWREKPDGSALQMTMLGPSIAEDITKSNIAIAYSGLLNRLGLSVSLNTTATDPSGFDIYLAMERLPLEPATIREIPMLADYSDPEITAALDAADDAIDMATRQTYVHQALGLISEKVLFAPVLSYDAIEAYNRTVYGGWVDMAGGINNFWSFTNLHKIQVGPLVLKTLSTSESSVESGGNVTVTVLVLDESESSVEGVNVELSADIGIFESPSGTTDSLGVFETKYVAPDVSDSTDVEIEATVFLQTYEGASDSIKLTVHPAVNPLDVDVTGTAPIINSGETTTVTVVITDKDLLPVANCTVHMSVDLAGTTLGTLTEVSDGEWSASFTGNVTTDTNFRVTVTAEKEGYQEGSGFANIAVRGWGGVVPKEVVTTEPIPDIGTFAVVAVTLLAVLVIASFRRREK
ncbi:MAG: ABC transporter substrate-binding protein [Thermoplasmata archaeon]